MKTRITELFAIKHPIIQGSMLGNGLQRFSVASHWRVD
jgi:NAD(P)H-dependent flavin oxidoreductase YrpB (nitropropane dioxygenase family)